MKPITEREEFESDCMYVIWYHDYYNLEDHRRAEIGMRSYQKFASDRPIYEEEIDNEN